MQKLILGIFLFVSCCTPLFAAKYSGGSGTPSDPYQIANAKDLIAMGENEWDYQEHFILTADIDFHPNQWTKTVFNESVIAPGTGKYRFQGSTFKGTFDGNHHVIRNLVINAEKYVGFFGGLGLWAVVKNLGLEQCQINGSDGYVGALAGTNDGGTIFGCYSIGTVKGRNVVGGLVGNSDGTVSNCYSSGVVQGTGAVGGLIGATDAESGISNCYSTCSVDADDSCGGLVGHNSGGLVYSYSIGRVTGDELTGGLVGRNFLNRVSNCFWDTETSGLASSVVGTGLTSAQMKDINTYRQAGWDLLGESDNGASEIWQFSTDDYPRLSIFEDYTPVEPQGQGTASKPYLISDANELGFLRIRPLAYYQLASDLDLAGITWTEAPVPCFGGTFLGSGFRIKNLTIKGGNNVGFFGLLYQPASISYLGLEGVVLEGSANVGALVGKINKAKVSTCYCSGSVTGYSEVGGLAGINHDGRFTDCYTTCNTTGEFSIGGFLGEQDYGDLLRCYNTGVVRGANSSTGGLVGTNWFGDVVDCFWDSTSTGITESRHGTGLTTAEMYSPDTYLAAGWDFAGESENGVYEIWQSIAGQYPVLSVFEGTHPVQYSGMGTQVSPYLVSDVFELAAIHLNPTAYYALANDLDLAPFTFEEAIVPYLGGTLDGNGHRILNLQLHGGDSLGIFNKLEKQGQIVNLRLENMSIEGKDTVGALVVHNAGSVINCYSTGAINGRYGVGGLVCNNSGLVQECRSECTIQGHSRVGGLVGSNEEPNSLVLNCEVSVTVEGQTQIIGGLVGQNYGEISDCKSDSIVRGGSSIGGLIGATYEGTGKISRCSSTGSVEGTTFAGGLIGNGKAVVSDCYSHCDVTGAKYTGGLMGSASGRLTNSYSTGTVRGDYNVGGLAGYAYGKIDMCYSVASSYGQSNVGGLVGGIYLNSSISNCYSTGPIEGDFNIGGLVGNNSGSIINSYSIGQVNGQNRVGGLVGRGTASKVSECFWDINTSGAMDSEGGTGLSTSDMKYYYTYLWAGWDFMGDDLNGTEDIWYMPEDDYPKLVTVDELDR